MNANDKKRAKGSSAAVRCVKTNVKRTIGKKKAIVKKKAASRKGFPVLDTVKPPKRPRPSRADE